MFYTQRRSAIVPNEWVRRYPAVGYDATQPLGIKTHEKGIKMMLIY